MSNLNSESKEVIDLAEKILEYSNEENIPLVDAVYVYLEDGPGSNHDWWDVEAERKMEIIEKLDKDFDVPEDYIISKVKENEDLLKDEGIKMKKDPNHLSEVNVPNAEISSYTVDHMYYDMLFETVRWIIDDLIHSDYPDLFDPYDFKQE